MTKTWFITGASSGLGLALAQHAIMRGYAVVAAARSLDALERLAASAPNQVMAVAMDVTDRDSVTRGVDAAFARFGRIDALFNNAGYGIVGAVEETPEDELRAQLETNFYGAVAVTKAALPRMRTQGSGAIINISSLGGQLSVPGFGAYSASKFALEGLSEALHGELAPFGIKVLIVEPGQLKTQFAGDALRHMPIIDAYQPTVGGTRGFAHAMHGTQFGDPMKAARAIETAIDADDAPLRLQIGDDAVDAVRNHALALLEELRRWEPVGRSIVADKIAA